MNLYIETYTFLFFFFKQKTAYEMRISDWSSYVCSSDLAAPRPADDAAAPDVAAQHQFERRARLQLALVDKAGAILRQIFDFDRIFDLLHHGDRRAAHQQARRAIFARLAFGGEIGRASGRGRVCQYGSIAVVD